MASSVDHDQMLHAASDLCLHCLLRPVFWNTFGKYGMPLTQFLRKWIIVSFSVLRYSIMEKISADDI